MAEDKWSKYARKENKEDKWSKYARKEQPKKPSFGNKLPSWLLGLGQFAEDTAKGQIEGIGESEVEFPEQWKPERIRKQNVPERTSPSFNLEQYVNPGKMTGFNIGRYGPNVALLGYGGAKGLSSIVKNSVGKARSLQGD